MIQSDPLMLVNYQFISNLTQFGDPNDPCDPHLNGSLMLQ
jgi:hypothetical protein